jgi:hypothetical protein
MNFCVCGDSHQAPGLHLTQLLWAVRMEGTNDLPLPGKEDVKATGVPPWPH